MASQMKITAPTSIQKLVETFEKNLPEYQSRKNETELRREFLDKFFTALGWDVDNLQGLGEAEKQVAHEPRWYAKQSKGTPRRRRNPGRVRLTI